MLISSSVQVGKKRKIQKWNKIMKFLEGQKKKKKKK